MIAGGGTGGHIFPALALGEAIKHLEPDWRILYVGTRYGLEGQIIPQRGHRLLYLPMRGVLGKGWLKRLALLWRIPLSVLLSLWLLLRFRPRLLIGVGGYASLPLLMVGGLLRVPTVLQEQNAYPGLSNRVLARVARVALVGFEEAARYLRCPSLATGNPVREAFYGVPDWLPERRQILIVGGSQGAACLNRIVPELLCSHFHDDSITVLHQCGKGRVDEVRSGYAEAVFPVQVSEFVDDMPAVLAQTRLVISRAGASTLSELKAARVPSVLVPFAGATHDHQSHNARSLAGQCAALLVREDELASAGDRIAALVRDTRRLEGMASACGRSAVQSAHQCASIALEIARRRPLDAIIARFESHVS